MIKGGFQVFTAVVMKSSVSSNITSCSPLTFNVLICQKIELFMIKRDHICYSTAKNLDCNFVKNPIPTTYSVLFIYVSEF
jgi:hypothetical protein